MEVCQYKTQDWHTHSNSFELKRCAVSQQLKKADWCKLPEEWSTADKLGKQNSLRDNYDTASKSSSFVENCGNFFMHYTFQLHIYLPLICNSFQKFCVFLLDVNWHRGCFSCRLRIISIEQEIYFETSCVSLYLNVKMSFNQETYEWIYTCKFVPIQSAFRQQAHKPQSYTSLKLRLTVRPTQWLTGVKNRATRVVKTSEKKTPSLPGLFFYSTWYRTVTY